MYIYIMYIYIYIVYIYDRKIKLRRELQDGPLAYKVLMVYAACFIIALPILGFLGFIGRSQNNDESHQFPSQEASV